MEQDPNFRQRRPAAASSISRAADSSSGNGVARPVQTGSLRATAPASMSSSSLTAPSSSSGAGNGGSGSSSASNLLGLHRPTNSFDGSNMNVNANTHRYTNSFDGSAHSSSSVGGIPFPYQAQQQQQQQQQHGTTGSVGGPGTPQRSGITATLTPQKSAQEQQALFNEHINTPGKDEPGGLGILASNAAAASAAPHFDYNAPREPVFLYSSLLLYALALPLFIMLAFGGKATLLVLAFGAVVAYIFDLLGSVEGTLMVALITILGVWASLVWAARVLLKQSASNFVILAVMGILLVYLYLLLAALFRSVRTEFESTLHFLEVIMFSTLPLVCSCVIAWFVCVEVPSLDVPTTMASTYFVYILVLGKPRVASSAASAPGLGWAARQASGQQQPPKNVLTPRVAAVLYLLPVYLCPCIHAGFNHSALYRAAMTGSLDKLSELAVSGLFPLLLMSQAALSHNYHTNANSNSLTSVAGGASSFSTSVVGALLQTTKLTAITGLLFCLQTHPYFSLLKSASGLPEPYCSLLFVLIGFLTGVGVWVNSGGRALAPKPWGSTDEDDDKKYAARHLGGLTNGLGLGGASTSRGPQLTQSFSRKLVVTVIAGAVCSLVGLGMGLPKPLVGLSGLGGMLFSEYAQRWAVSTGWCTFFVGQALVMGASGVASLAALNLTGKTLYFLDVDFSWYGVSISIKQICLAFMITVSSAVGISSLALQAKTKSTTTAFLPTSASNLASYIGTTTAGRGHILSVQSLFANAFTLFLLAISGFELFAREQDWEAWETNAEDVYPTFLLGLTALLASMLSYHLYSKGLLGLPHVFSILAMQSCKMLHVLNVPSNAIAAMFGLVLAYTLPFVTHREVLGLGLGLDVPSKDEGDADGVSVVNSNAAAAAAADVSPSKAKPVSASVAQAAAAAAASVSALRLWFYFILCVTATALARRHLLHALLEYVLLRDASPSQSTAAAVALMASFSAALLHCFMPKSAVFRSMLLCVAGVSILVATQALGPVTISIDPTAPLYVSIAFNQSEDEGVLSGGFGDTGLYLMLASALLVLAAGGVIAVRRPISRLLFLCGMTYCGGKALTGWAFPLSLGADSPHYGPWQIPALFGHIQVGLACYAGIYASVRPSAAKGGAGGSSGGGSGGGLTSGASLVFILSALVPLACLLYSSLLHEHEHTLGIMWGAVAVNGIVAFVVRCSEMSRQVEAVKKDDAPAANTTPQMLQEISNHAASAAAAGTARVDAGSAAVCQMAAGLAILWCFAASLVTPHVDADTSVPLSFLLLLCTRRLRREDSHPLALATVLAVAFWLGSTAYSILLKNFGQERKPEGFDPSIGLFKDEDVSLWTSSSTYHWVPLANALLALLPLPAVGFSYLRRKGDSEDTIFVLAILSVVSVVGGMCWSVRYIGLAGLGYASYRCWEIGNTHKNSDRLI